MTSSMRYLELVGDRFDQLVRVYADRIILEHHLSEVEAWAYASNLVDNGWAVAVGQVWQPREGRMDPIVALGFKEDPRFTVRQIRGVEPGLEYVVDGPHSINVEHLFHNYELVDWPAEVGAES